MKSGNMFILHPGKANYPEIKAYSEFFSAKGWNVKSGVLSAYDFEYEKSECNILWCIMGLYPRKIKADFIIHDYRSLSTGYFVELKDLLKRNLNAKPDLRIFQNILMRDLMGFNDGVDEIILPMGIPDWIFDLKVDAPTDVSSGKFCYIGAISKERGFDQFLSDYKESKLIEDGEELLLVGEPDRDIYAKYKSTPGIIFAGKLPQNQALKCVLSSEFAISLFAYHRPHCYQTPTKLLEYAALGKKIICNNSPSNISTAKDLGINCVITGPRMFLEIPNIDIENVKKNDVKNFQSLTWSSVIMSSGIVDYIDRL